MAEGGGVVIDKNSLVKEIGQHYKKTPCVGNIWSVLSYQPCIQICNIKPFISSMCVTYMSIHCPYMQRFFPSTSKRHRRKAKHISRDNDGQPSANIR